MKLEQKNIGIWGFGIVGKAAAQYLHNKCKRLEILDKRQLTCQEQDSLQQLGATWSQGDDHETIKSFITRNHYIIVSPGVDTRAYSYVAHKFIAELDLFHSLYKKPIIAITGSVGKTTITHLLGNILSFHNPRWWIGGNIGTGMLDVLKCQDQTDGAIIELSSFQLDQCKSFAPDLAIITNIYPNHLDRHGNFINYVQAKAKIFAHQQNEQVALMPLALRSTLGLDKEIASTVHFFCPTKPDHASLQQLPSTNILFYYDNGNVMAYKDSTSIMIVESKNLPSISFSENWLVICAVLFLCQKSCDNLNEIVSHIALPEHRLEYVSTIDGIDFFNDSKGTTTAATLAAINKLKNRPIILILGGIGKGVDRTDFIKQIKGDIKAIICFGDEREILAKACKTYEIPFAVTETLDAALDTSLKLANRGEQIVLSPAGSSFDQFKNYQERGDHFKKCIGLLRSKK